jgi:hypothetical protein
MKKFIALLTTLVSILIPILMAVYVTPYAVSLLAVPAVVSPFMLLDAFSN